MKKILALFILMLTIFSKVCTADCNITLSGKVSDTITTEPLDGAIVSITNKKGVLKYSAVTDLEGKYVIKNICQGEYQIIISHLGCKNRIFNLFLDGNIRKDFAMDHHREELQEVEIMGRRMNKTATSTEVVLDKLEITEYAETNLGTALSRIAGVATFSTGNSIVKPVVHGLHSSRVPILNNGIKQEDQQWGVEHAPNIDLNVANTLRVIKGAGALEYTGDAIGGVVLVEPKRLIPGGTALQGSLLSGFIFNGRGANVSAHVEKGFDSGISLYLQGSYKRLGDLSAPKYILANTGTEERNFSFQSQYQKGHLNIVLFYSLYSNELGILKAAHIGSLEDLLYVINRREPLTHADFNMTIAPPKQNILHHFAKINANYLFELGKLDVIYSYQFNNRKEYDIRKGDYKELPSMNLDLITQNIKVDFMPEQMPYRKSKMGTSFVMQKNRPVYGTKATPLIPFYYQYEIGAYRTESYEINDNLTIEAGIRTDWRRIEAEKLYSFERWKNLGYNNRYAHLIVGELSYSYITKPTLSFWSYSATAGLNYHLSKLADISCNYSLSSRAPNVAELFSDGLHHSAAAVELGDLELTNEKSNKFITTLNGRLSRGFNVELSAHFNYLKNFINQVPKGAEHNIRGAFPVWAFEQTNAYILGVDCDVEYEISSQWVATSNFAYLYGQDNKNNIPLINMPPISWKNTLEYKNSKWNKFHIKLSHNTVFKQLRYPENYNFNLRLIENNEWVYKELDITTPPPAYQLLDLNMGITFPIIDKQQLITSFAAQNIFNISHRDYLNRLRYYADNSGINFILKIQYIF